MNDEGRRERAWVVSSLAELIATHGADSFLSAPLLTPSPRWFPDPWSPDLDGARAMLTRLLGFAGLGRIPLLLRAERDPTRDLADATSALNLGSSHRGAAAWFEGRAIGGLRFGVEPSQLSDAEALVGVLAHECCHAWRGHHGCEVGSRDEEERLTDLTTIFLGFGVLTTNNARRQRAVGFSLQSNQYGYVRAPTMAFALAVQLAVRGRRAEQQRVLAALEQDQRIIVKEALAELQADPEGLRASLGLPAATPDVVFRVRATPWLPFAAGGFVVGCVGWLATAHVAPAVLGPLLATSMAFALRRDLCSGPECGARLPAKVARCPSCRGRIVGRLARVEEHPRAAAEFLAQSDLAAPEPVRQLVDHALRHGGDLLN